MKIHAYLLCFNEAPIIPYIFDYYSKICSRIFLLDNHSTDNSIELAKRYPNVEVMQWDSAGKLDDQLHIDMKSTYYRRFSRQGSPECIEAADWIIAADMDELVYHPRLAEVLERETSQGTTVADIIGFDMVSSRFPEPGQSLVKDFRYGVRSGMMDKPILFSSSIDMEFSPGCHSVGSTFEKMATRPNYKLTSERFALLHYKHIGDRFAVTARRSSARLSERNLNNGWGLHYVRPAENLRKITSNMLEKSQDILADSGEFALDLSQFKTHHVISQFAIDGLMLTLNDAEFFKSLAIIFERIDLEIATRLMLRAKELRPFGPAINQKLKIYREQSDRNAVPGN